MIDLNDVLRVVAEWSGPDGSIAQLVWHYVVDAGNDEDPDDVLADIITNFETAWANIETIIHQGWQSTTLELYQRNVGLHQWDGVSVDTSLALDGASATEGQAHGAAGLVKIFTEAARRQSRKYIHGIIETVISNGVIQVTGTVPLGLFVADLDDSVISGTETLVYGTYNTDPLSDLYESFSRRNQNAAVEAVVAYQRRRRPGTGI